MSRETVRELLSKDKMYMYSSVTSLLKYYVLMSDNQQRFGV